MENCYNSSSGIKGIYSETCPSIFAVENDKMEKCYNIGIGFWQKGSSLKDIEIDPKHMLRSGLRGVSRAPLFRRKDYTDSMLLGKIDWFVTKIWTWINLHQTIVFITASERVKNLFDNPRVYVSPTMKEYIRNLLLYINPIVEALTPGAGKIQPIPPPPAGTSRSDEMAGVITKMEELRDYRQAFNILQEFDRFNRREITVRPIVTITDKMYQEQILRLTRLYHVLTGFNVMGAYAKLSDLERFDPNKEIFFPEKMQRVKNMFSTMLDPRVYVGSPVEVFSIEDVAIIGSNLTYDCPHCSRQVDIASCWNEELSDKEPSRCVVINHDDNTFYHACYGK